MCGPHRWHSTVSALPLGADAGRIPVPGWFWLFFADIEDAQDEDHEQEAAPANQEAAGQLSHGRDRVRQPLGWREEKVDAHERVGSNCACLVARVTGSYMES